MFSFSHLAIIFLIALLVFGPEKLPEIARQIGKVMGDFRRASTDFRRVIEQEFAEIERQNREKEEAARRKALETGSPALSATADTPTLPSSGHANPTLAGAEAGTPRAPEGSVPNTTAKDSGYSISDNPTPAEAGGPAQSATADAPTSSAPSHDGYPA